MRQLPATKPIETRKSPRERWLPAFHRAAFTVEGLHYEIANLGRVRNLKTGRIFEGRINKNGYRVIDLCGKTFNAHAVVWRTFKGLPPTCMHSRGEEVYCEIDHRNHCRHDARLRNLQPLTHSENLRRRRRHLSGGRSRKAA